jgi:ribosomal protein S18 acetylase RimI-like enzyme
VSCLPPPLPRLLLRPVARAHRARLEQLTRDTGLFREEEVATAVELFDESLAGDDDYQFVGAFEDDQLVGYACWGPTPGTETTHDLYWIVVDRQRQGSGIGTELLREVEARLTARGARLIVVETSSRSEYVPTRAFYEARGYTRAATIPEYYAPGDDLVIYTKDLTTGDLARAAP